TTGRLSIDAAKVAAEARLDGKYLLATSDPDLSAEDVALGYKNSGPAGSLQQTTRLTDTQTKLFKDCGVPLPPKMSALKTPE
uniref:hypothetical protein n=1 Tax=Streptomyces sp. x-19 TaxID=2789280 RepID=UPI0039809C16